MRWLTRAQGNPAIPGTGADRLQYFGIVQLRPTDATTLATAARRVGLPTVKVK
jgi:hypothetical protein